MITQTLTTLRELNGYTMKEVAEGIGIKADTYRSYERGRLQPNLETIVKLAGFYKVSTDYLLGVEPLPDPFADLNLREKTEADVLKKYMSLPADMRAMALELLRQLGGAVSEADEEESPTLTRTTTAGEFEDQWKAEQDAEKDEGKSA